MPGVDQFSGNGPAWALVGVFILAFFWVGKFVRDLVVGIRADSTEERKSCQEVNRGLLTQQARLADAFEELAEASKKKNWGPQ